MPTDVSISTSSWGSVQSLSLVPMAGGAALPLQFTTSALKPGQVQFKVPAGTAAGRYQLSLTDGSSCGAILDDALTIVDQATLLLATPSMTPAFGSTGTQTAVTVDAANVSGGTAEAQVAGTYEYDARSNGNHDKTPVKFNASLVKESVGWRLNLVH